MNRPAASHSGLPVPYKTGATSVDQEGDGLVYGANLKALEFRFAANPHGLDILSPGAAASCQPWSRRRGYRGAPRRPSAFRIRFIDVCAGWRPSLLIRCVREARSAADRRAASRSVVARIRCTIATASSTACCTARREADAGAAFVAIAVVAPSALTALSRCCSAPVAALLTP